VRLGNITNFAMAWPVRAEHLKCGPCTTSLWHVGKIQDEKTVGICVITDNPDTRSSWATIRPLLGSIHAIIDIGLTSRSKSVLHRNLLVHVSANFFSAYRVWKGFLLHVTVCRIIRLGLSMLVSCNLHCEAYAVVVEFVEED